MIDRIYALMKKFVSALKRKYLHAWLSYVPISQEVRIYTRIGISLNSLKRNGKGRLEDRHSEARLLTGSQDTKALRANPKFLFPSVMKINYKKKEKKKVTRLIRLSEVVIIRCQTNCEIFFFISTFD